MNVLIVAHQFAPFNASGSIRVTKLAEYLDARGHNVRVLTCGNLGFPRNLPTRFPSSQVTRTGWINLDAWINFARRLFSQVTSGHEPSAVGRGSSRARGVAAFYRSIVGIPDSQAGWLYFALKAGVQMIDAAPPDVVISSALPFTAHIIGAKLAHRSGALWVADYRDLFVGNPYQHTLGWRRWLDVRLEQRVIRDCALVTSVSSPLAEVLHKAHRKPTLVIRNGYDPLDLPGDMPPDCPPERLRILHTGTIYPGRRDPEPLFRALANGWSFQNIEVEFVGQDNRGILALSKAHGVDDCVIVRGPISYSDSLRAQAGADILLLLLGTDAEDDGVFTGKFFEYVAAGRPILCLGTPNGVAAESIRTHNLGIVANNSQEICAALQVWSQHKRLFGQLRTPLEQRAEFDRFKQYDTLEKNIIHMLNQRNRSKS